MNQFKDFGIKTEANFFIGRSIDLEQITNVPIQVHDFKIEPSKKKPGTEYLTLQIEIDKTKRVVFTGATILIQAIKQVPKEGFPFNTTILKKDKYYEFT
jgi:hypothetical protein